MAFFAVQIMKILQPAMGRCPSDSPARLCPCTPIQSPTDFAGFFTIFFTHVHAIVLCAGLCGVILLPLSSLRLASAAATRPSQYVHFLSLLLEGVASMDNLHIPQTKVRPVPILVPKLSLGHPGSFTSEHVLKCLHMQTA